MHKRALLAVVLIVALAFGVGFGTMAWFTSSAKSTNNTFAAGTLKVNENGITVSHTNEIDITNLQPGDKTSFNFDVVNDGSLEFKYRFKLDNIKGKLTKGDHPLQISLDDSNWKNINSNYFENDNYVLASDETENQTIYMRMPEAAGNEYQDKSGSFRIVIEAIQNAHGATFDSGSSDPSDPDEPSEPTDQEVAIEGLIEAIEALPSADEMTMDNYEDALASYLEVDVLIVETLEQFPEIDMIEDVSNYDKYEDGWDKLDELESNMPIYTGEITFKATKNGSTRNTSNKEINFYTNDAGFKVIEVTMGDGDGEFEEKVGDFTITEEIDDGTTYFRVITENEYYAGPGRNMMRCNADYIDTSENNVIKFFTNEDRTTEWPYLFIECDELYDWMVD